MKIAVYAIAKNEESNVEAWLKNMSEADGVFVLDTGSTDTTISLLKAGGATVNVRHLQKTFRFDEARNEAASYVPDDYDVLVSVDFDERFVPGWREQVEACFSNTDVCTASYTLVYSYTPDGVITVAYPRVAMHRPKAATWLYAVHEVLVPSAVPHVSPAKVPELMCVHYGAAKQAGHYLDLLKLAYQENPKDARSAQYLAREYYHMGNLPMSRMFYKEHIELEEYAPFRSESATVIARMADSFTESEWWHKQAIQYCNNIREPYCELASFYFNNKLYELCVAVVRNALMYERPDYSMIYREDYYSGSWCNHMLMASYSQLGNLREANAQKDILLSLYQDTALPSHIQEDIARVDQAVKDAHYVYLSSLGI